MHGDLRGVRFAVIRSRYDLINLINPYSCQSNVFVDDHWCVRLADFGLAGWADGTLTTNSTNRAGSIRWMAPELHGYEGPILRTAASDTYAFACVCVGVNGSCFVLIIVSTDTHCTHQLYTGNSPFADIRMDSAVIFKVLRGERPARFSPFDHYGPHISDDLWSLMQDCWRQHPSDRPNIALVVDIMADIIAQRVRPAMFDINIGDGGEPVAAATMPFVPQPESPILALRIDDNVDMEDADIVILPAALNLKIHELLPKGVELVRRAVDYILGK